MNILANRNILKISSAFLCLYTLIFASLHCSEASELIQNEFEYIIVPGDSPGVIAGKLGLNWDVIAQQNSLNPKTRLKVGRALKVHFIRIVPETIEDGIIINIPDRTLYRFEGGRLKDYYFIAAGKPTWQTPLGDFIIKAKAKDPTWYVPPSIQREMENEGKEILIEVPPGPDNPLGDYWFQLSLSGIGLHGTNAPQSIYRFVSHGCMRLSPDVAEKLFAEVPVGTKGRIVYRPVKAAKTSDGRIFLEAYRDFYKKGIDFKAEATGLLDGLGAPKHVDWEKVDDVLTKKEGVVVEVTK
jgi:L,D-transpeptidase ErfK/SrfK